MMFIQDSLDDVLGCSLIVGVRGEISVPNHRHPWLTELSDAEIKDLFALRKEALGA